MFIMSFSKEHKIPLKEVKKMGADEMAEWMAFYMLQDDEKKNELKMKVQEESSQVERNKNLVRFLSRLRGK